MKFLKGCGVRRARTDYYGVDPDGVITELGLQPVTWPEAVGLRTRPVSDQKIGLGLGLAGLVLLIRSLS